MTKRKIIIIVVLVIEVVIALAVATMSLVRISHKMDISAPDQIAVYYNNTDNNKVFDKDTTTYKEIYNAIDEGFKQKMISALLKGKLFKDVDIIAQDTKKMDLNGLTIVFMYNSPQVLKYKTKDYISGGKNYWYQSLVFKINTGKSFNYNTIAIIPPETSSEYVSDFTYTLHYNAYANLNKAHTIALDLFE